MKGRKSKNMVGKTYKTTEGYTAEIIEYNGWYDSTIKFNDNTILKGIIMSSLNKGNIKNPNHKTIHGVGYFGVGKYKTVNEDLKCYLVWRSMMQRCYDTNYQKRQPTYIDCSVTDEWHNFQTFAKWFYQNYNPEIMEDWQLDKDFIIKYNRVYSPEACVFIPREINNLIASNKTTRGEYPVGVSKRECSFQARLSKNGIRISIGRFKTEEEAFQAYKKAKESYIKEVAEKWKDKIDIRVYEILIKHKVEITN